MRQWRVGSFSMGLLLVLLGVGLLLDRFTGGVSALELINNWWPAALILLGVEVLAAGFLSRSETFKLNYDFWSILLVIIFFIFSLGSYAVSYSGIIPLVRETLHSSERSVTIPAQQIPLDGAKKVVLSFADGNLELRDTDGDSLQIFGQASVFASSNEEAESLAGLGNAEVHRSGDTLFIEIRQAPARRGPFVPGVQQISRKVLVPSGVALEVKDSSFRSSGGTQVVLDSLAAPWSLDVINRVKVTLSPGLDVQVYGTVEWPGGLTGSVEWEPPSGELPEEATSGTIKLGESAWPLNISSREIEVNIR